MFIQRGDAIPQEVLHFEDQHGVIWLAKAGADIEITPSADETVVSATSAADYLLVIDMKGRADLTLKPRPCKSVRLKCAGRIAIHPVDDGYREPMALPRLGALHAPRTALGMAFDRIADKALGREIQ